MLMVEAECNMYQLRTSHCKWGLQMPASVTTSCRALTWYHNGNKLTSGGRITLSSDNTTLTVINSTGADSGVYVVRFDGLLIHPYSRIREEAVLDVLRHYTLC